MRTDGNDCVAEGTSLGVAIRGPDLIPSEAQHRRGEVDHQPDEEAKRAGASNATQVPLRVAYDCDKRIVDEASSNATKCTSQRCPCALRLGNRVAPPCHIIAPATPHQATR